MRSILKGSCLAVSLFALFAVSGCSQDNEAFVKAQADATADKAAPAPKTPPPKNQQDYYKQQQQNNAFSKSSGSGYPGAK